MTDHDRLTSITSPIPHETTINEISRQSSYYRDAYIVKEIASTLKSYNRILIIYGWSHAIMQERALNQIAQQIHS